MSSLSNESLGLVRLLLSKAAGNALEAAGTDAFAIIARAKRGAEDPETAGRWEITLAGVEWATACDASRVLLGEMKATKIRRPVPVDTTHPSDGGAEP